MDSNIAQLLLESRWWILVPLSFVESPVVAFLAGTLASLGYFNPFALGAYFFIKDIAFDAGFYYLGHHSAKSPFVQRMLKKVGVTEEHFSDIKERWEKHPGWTMFIGKVSYGIAMGFIVAAGAVAAILQYWTLILVGYFFGASFGSLEGIISNLELVLGVGGLLFSIYIVGAFYLRRRALKKHELS